MKLTTFIEIHYNITIQIQCQSLISKECTLQLAAIHSQQGLTLPVIEGRGGWVVPELLIWLQREVSSLMALFPCQQTVTAVRRLSGTQSRTKKSQSCLLSRFTCSHRAVSHTHTRGCSHDTRYLMSALPFQHNPSVATFH
jgi:hypothetical protein